MATVTSLGFSIFSSYNGKGVKQARRDIDKLNSSLGKLGTWSAPVVAASAAAVPALASVTAAAGAMTAGLTAAGAGTAAVAAVAIPAFTDIGEALKYSEQAAMGSEAAQEKLNKQLAEMSPAARTLMKDWQGLTKEYDEWAKSLQPDVLPMFSQGIDLVRGNLEKLNPLVRRSSDAFEDLIGDLDRSLQHPFWDEFGSRVEDLAPQAIRSFGRAGGNIAVGVAGIINAFMPSAPGMLQLVEDIAAGFAKWGRNLEGSEDFKDFMAYVQKTGPYVRAFFEKLGPAVENILRGLSPLGPAALQVGTAFAQMIASAPPEVITAIALAITGIGIALKTAKLVSILTAISNPMSLVIAGVGLLAAGLVIAYQESETFRNIVNDAWSAIKDGWDAFWDAVGPELRDWWRVLKEDLGPVLKDLKDIGVDTWNGLNNAAGDFMEGFSDDSKDHKGEINDLADAYRSAGKEFEELSGGKSLFETFAEAVAGAVNDHIIKPLRGAKILLSWLDDYVKEHNDNKGLWESFGEGFRIGVYDNIVKPLQGLQKLLTWIDNWFADTSGYEGFWSFIGAGFVQLGQVIWDGLKFLFHDPGLGGLMWDYVVMPIWDGLMWLLHDPGIGGLIWDGLELIWEGFVWLYNTLVGNSVIPDMVNEILRWTDKLSGGFLGDVTKLAKGAKAWFADLKSDGIKKVNDLKNGVVARAKILRKEGLAPLRQFRDGAINAFDDAQKGIGRKWDNLRRKAAAPVGFVVNTVYMRGIRPVWNAVAKKAGLGELPAIHMRSSNRGGRARGGFILPGDSSYRDGDDQLVPMRRGEGVSVSELMRDPFERTRLLTLNKAAMQGGLAAVRKVRERLDTGGNPRSPNYAPKADGFAKGGLFGGAKRFIAAAKDQFASGDFLKLAKRALNPFKNAVRGRFGRGEWPNAYNRLVGKAVSGAVKKLSNVADIFSYGLAGFGSLKDVSAALRRGAQFVRRTVGRPYKWGGGGPRFDCSGYMAGIENAIRNVNPPSHYGRRYTTFSFRGRSAPPGWVLGLRSPFQVGVTNRGVGHMAGTLLGVNVESSGSRGTHAGRSARGANHPMFGSRYGFAPVMRGRAMGGLVFDEGGYLPPGKSLVDNQTGRPEPLRNTDLDRGGDANYYITINVPANANKAELGKVTVEAIQEYERRSGKRWRKD